MSALTAIERQADKNRDAILTRENMQLAADCIAFVRESVMLTPLGKNKMSLVDNARLLALAARIEAASSEERER